MSASSIDLGELIRLIEMRGSGRLIVGIAGAPGSGKSTIAGHLEISFNANRPGFAANLPMDGFHFDDMLLEKLNRRARKGLPTLSTLAVLFIYSCGCATMPKIWWLCLSLTGILRLPEVELV